MSATLRYAIFIGCALVTLVVAFFTGYRMGASLHTGEGESGEIRGVANRLVADTKVLREKLSEVEEKYFALESSIISEGKERAEELGAEELGALLLLLSNSPVPDDEVFSP